VIGHVKLAPSDHEIFEDPRRTSLDHATMVRVRWIARDPALDGGTHGAGTVHDTHRVVDVHRHGGRLRTTFSRIGSSSQEAVLTAIVKIRAGVTQTGGA
jgi:hypothetical protein